MFLVTYCISCFGVFFTLTPVVFLTPKNLADEINFLSKKLFWVKVSRLAGFIQSSYSVKIWWSLPLCSEEKLAPSRFNISQTLYVGCLIERLDLVAFIKISHTTHLVELTWSSHLGLSNWFAQSSSQTSIEGILKLLLICKVLLCNLLLILSLVKVWFPKFVARWCMVFTLRSLWVTSITIPRMDRLFLSFDVNL